MFEALPCTQGYSLEANSRAQLTPVAALVETVFRKLLHGKNSPLTPEEVEHAQVRFLEALWWQHPSALESRIPPKPSVLGSPA